MYNKDIQDTTLTHGNETMTNFKAIVTRQTLQDMSTLTTYRHNETVEGNPAPVNILINVDGLFGAELKVGTVWQASRDSALAAASFILGRPTTLGKTTLVN